MSTIEIKTVDDLIYYLVESKKETQEQNKKAYNTPAVQNALAALRASSKM